MPACTGCSSCGLLWPWTSLGSLWSAGSHQCCQSHCPVDVNRGKWSLLFSVQWWWGGKYWIYAGVNVKPRTPPPNMGKRGGETSRGHQGVCMAINYAQMGEVETQNGNFQSPHISPFMMWVDYALGVEQFVDFGDPKLGFL